LFVEPKYNVFRLNIAHKPNQSNDICILCFAHIHFIALYYFSAQFFAFFPQFKHSNLNPCAVETAPCAVMMEVPEPTTVGALELRRVASVSNYNSMTKISIPQARQVQLSRFGSPTIPHRSEKS
jgi:hypothetical protein